MFRPMDSKDFHFESSFREELVSVVWKIKNFSKSCSYIMSPEFKCGETECYLYINSGTDGDNTGFVSASIIKVKYSNEVYSVNFKVGLKDIYGRNQQCYERFYEEFKHYGTDYEWIEIIDLNVLFTKKRSELLPSDELTIFCELEISHGNRRPKQVNKLSGFSDASTSTVTMGTDILARDLDILFKDKDSCDVTFHVGDETFPAHKLILRARVPVFAAMFRSNMKENLDNTITVTDISPADFWELLRYIYSGKVQDLTVDRAAGLYAAADKYDLKELKQECVDFIIATLSVHWFPEIAELAYLHNDGLMIDEVKVFANKNSALLLSTKEWQALVQRNPSFASEILMAMIQNYTPISECNKLFENVFSEETQNTYSIRVKNITIGENFGLYIALFCFIICYCLKFYF